MDDLDQAEAELAIYRDEAVLSIIGLDAYIEGLQERADRVNVAVGVSLTSANEATSPNWVRC